MYEPIHEKKELIPGIVSWQHLSPSKKKVLTEISSCTGRSSSVQEVLRFRVWDFFLCFSSKWFKTLQTKSYLDIISQNKFQKPPLDATFMPNTTDPIANRDVRQYNFESLQFPITFCIGCERRKLKSITACGARNVCTRVEPTEFDCLVPVQSQKSTAVPVSITLLIGCRRNPLLSE